MRTYTKLAAVLTAVTMGLSSFSSTLFAETNSFEQVKAPVIAVVDFKICLDKSKLGQQEQASLESMKKQMETILQEKEKKLTEASAKFNDMDYLDSLSPEAEADLKKELRNLNQEFTQQHTQFYQTFSQASTMVVQKLIESVTKAADQVAKAHKIDLVLNKEGCFYNAPALDISSLVVAALDENFAKENNSDTQKTTPAVVK